MDDENKAKLGRLIDAATAHVNKNGVVDKKTGAVRFNKKAALGKPAILPGLPAPKVLKGGSALTIARNTTNDKVRLRIIVGGDITGEAIMNAQTFEQFIFECQNHLSYMKEGPVPAGAVTLIKE